MADIHELTYDIVVAVFIHIFISELPVYYRRLLIIAFLYEGVSELRDLFTLVYKTHYCMQQEPIQGNASYLHGTIY